MLTPLEPKAGPTGGAGVAFPASICNLITLTHGSQFHFNIKLEKGAINEY